MLLISDALEYVHATVFFYIFENLQRLPPPMEVWILYDIFFFLSCKLRNPICLFDARVNPDLASWAPLLLSRACFHNPVDTAGNIIPADRDSAGLPTQSLHDLFARPDRLAGVATLARELIAHVGAIDLPKLY